MGTGFERPVRLFAAQGLSKVLKQRLTAPTTQSRGNKTAQVLEQLQVFRNDADYIMNTEKLGVSMEDSERTVETILAKEAVPTYCLRRVDHDVETPEALPHPSLEIVIPMGMEDDAYSAVRRQWGPMSRLFPPGLEVHFRTILFHLARDQFGDLASGADGLVSVNITNLRTPESRSYRKTKSRVLTYHVDLVAVGTLTSGERKNLGTSAREVAARFNTDSRYLKIGKLRLGFVPARQVRERVEMTAIP